MSARRRGNDGHRCVVERFLPIRAGLASAFLTEECKPPRPVKVAKVYHGPKPATGAKRCELSDADFLCIRALSKFHKLSSRQIAELLGQPQPRVAQILAYVNRAHLEPAPGHCSHLPLEKVEA